MGVRDCWPRLFPVPGSRGSPLDWDQCSTAVQLQCYNKYILSAHESIAKVYITIIISASGSVAIALLSYFFFFRNSYSDSVQSSGLCCNEYFTNVVRVAFNK